MPKLLGLQSLDLNHSETGFIRLTFLVINDALSIFFSKKYKISSYPLKSIASKLGWGRDECNTKLNAKTLISGCAKFNFQRSLFLFSSSIWARMTKSGPVQYSYFSKIAQLSRLKYPGLECSRKINISRLISCFIHSVLKTSRNWVFVT